MVVVVLEWGKGRMFTKENHINANDRLTGGGRAGGDGGMGVRGAAPGSAGKLNLGITIYLSTL
jgi:hypothetical protein